MRRCVVALVSSKDYKSQLSTLESKGWLADDLNERNLAIAEALKKKGHTCIKILEKYPVQITWCGNVHQCEKKLSAEKS